MNRIVPSVLVCSLGLALVAEAQSLSANAAGPAAAPVVPRMRAGAGAGGSRALSILVYDTNTQHQLALTAAMNIEPTGTVQATSADFETLIASQTWDAIFVDCPSNKPNDWTPLANYITSGGPCVMTYWDWDNPSTPGTTALLTAMEVTVASTFSLVGQTMTDSGTSPVFNGVTMPNSDWHDHWSDDGDNFNPIGSAIGIAHLGSPAQPAVVLGNSGKTIAAPCFDEAGDTWLNSGEGVLLWENMINHVLGGSLSTDVDQISLSTGGQQVLTMNLTPTAALKTYQILGSASGAVPGLVYTGTLVPLNPDAYTIFTLLNPNQPPLLNSAGTLDINGKATAVFTLPPGTDPSLVGLVVNHAGITIELIGPNIVVTEATDPASCTLVP